MTSPEDRATSSHETCPLLSPVAVGDRILIRLPSGVYPARIKVHSQGYVVAESCVGVTIVNRGFLKREGVSWFYIMANHKKSESIRVGWGGRDCCHALYAVPSHGRWYYRYVVNDGRKVLLSKHIPGGAVGNPIADARACEVGRHCAGGRSPDSVLELISSWGRRR